MTAPARRSVRTQPPRKSTTRSAAMPQQPPSLPHDTHSADDDDDDDDEEEEEEEEELDQEESSDGGSVTRCLCGEQHNVGLMVQCDRCEVWQHCDCVGLTENDMPELYYCDHCQPDNHVLYKSHGRYKRAYDPNGISTGKKEDIAMHHATSTGDDTEHRAVKRRKRQQDHRRNRKRPPSRSQKSAGAAAAERHEDTTEDEPPEEDRSTSPATVSSSTAPSSIPASVAHAVAHAAIATTSSHRQHSPSSPKASPLSHINTAVASKSSRPVNGRRNGGGSGGSSNGSGGGGGPSPQQQEKRMKKGSPRPSTPDDMPMLHQPYWDQDGLPARESSPPARIKYPNPKMSIADMNKRAKQILDYVSKLQIDMATTKRRERSNSTSSSSSSLSSASTLPLAEEANNDTGKVCISPTTPIPALQQQQQQQQLPPPPPESALEMMDRITHDLVMFQRKFGSTLRR